MLTRPEAQKHGDAILTLILNYGEQQGLSAADVTALTGALATSMIAVLKLGAVVAGGAFASSKVGSA